MDFYATDQLRLNLTADGFKGSRHVVHAQAVKVIAATGERPSRWRSFPLCGTSRPEGAVMTSLEVTCKRCARLVDAHPCQARFTRWRNTFGCEKGGTHLTHYALAGTVTWRADQTAETCEGGRHTVLWRDKPNGITVTVHTVPTAVAGHSGPVEYTVYTWFLDGREVESGTDREKVEADIPARLKELRDESEHYGAPADRCREWTAKLHVCD